MNLIVTTETHCLLLGEEMPMQHFNATCDYFLFFDCDIQRKLLKKLKP